MLTGEQSILTRHQNSRELVQNISYPKVERMIYKIKLYS